MVDPAPRLRPPAPGVLRVVYLVLGGFQGTLLGLLLTLSPRVLYARYALAPRVTSLAPLDDEVLAGIVMWAAAGAIDMLGVLLVVARALTAGGLAATPSRARTRLSPPARGGSRACAGERASRSARGSFRARRS